VFGVLHARLITKTNSLPTTRLSFSHTMHVTRCLVFYVWKVNNVEFCTFHDMQGSLLDVQFFTCKAHHQVQFHTCHKIFSSYMQSPWLDVQSFTLERVSNSEFCIFTDKHGPSLDGHCMQSPSLDGHCMQSPSLDGHCMQSPSLDV
jgi:hypothetical protein